jgi:hypothetical protein
LNGQKPSLTVGLTTVSPFFVNDALSPWIGRLFSAGTPLSLNPMISRAPEPSENFHEIGPA